MMILGWSTFGLELQLQHRRENKNKLRKTKRFHILVEFLFLGSTILGFEVPAQTFSSHKDEVWLVLIYKFPKAIWVHIHGWR